MATSKGATSVFLMRILVKKWHKIFLWFWTISILLLGVLGCIAVMAQCTPIESLWDSKVPQESCSIDLVTLSYAICSWSAVMDFVLAISPWFALWGLNMKFKEKVNICLSLSLGIIACICGTTGLDAQAVSDDYLYAVTESCIWTNSEITLTIICVSIPPLRPLYRSIRGDNSSNDASQYNHISPYSAQKLSAEKSQRPDYALESLTTTTVHGKTNGNDRFTGPSSGIEGLDTRHILKDQIYETNAIHQTTEVDLSYEDRKGNDVVAVPVKARQHI